jgi:putative membrane protein
VNSRISPLHLLLLLAAALVFAWSAWRPHDRLTWWLETIPAIIGVTVLIATYSHFRFTTLVYTLVALNVCILCVGGHYTYAHVPLFEWLKPIFGWHRNHFDRLGHFAQGFVPALIARELFIRLGVIRSRAWMFVIVLFICLGISALYELIEWWTALASGSAATEFLGTQGDIWDTQKDMCMALIGALCALLFMTRWQNRQMRRLPGAP